MNPVIHRLDPQQWRLYRDVRLAALRDAPDAFATTYEQAEALSETDWQDGAALPCWLAFDGEQAVGMVRIGRFDGAAPHLLSMWVAPSARGSGAGTLLVHAALDWARAQGDTSVDLRVVTANESARTFYQRCGFDATGATFTLSDGRPEIEMAIRLS